MPLAAARPSSSALALFALLADAPATPSTRLHALGRRVALAMTPAPRQLHASSELLEPSISREFFRQGSESAAIMEDVPSPIEMKDHDSDDELLSEPGGAPYVVRVFSVDVRLGNGVQRLLSALALAPLITYFLWRSPAFATTTVCAIVVSASCYEYAWLAHRIHSRFVFAVNKLDEASTTRVSSYSSTRSLSYHSNGPTPPSSGRENAMSLEPLQEERIAAKGKRCAVSSLADSHFCGSEWLVAVVISLVGTAVSSSIFTLIASSDAFNHLDFGGFRIYYSIISSFCAWLCACLTPDWRYGFLLIMEKEIFTSLTLYSMKCPINNVRCNSVIQPSMLMLGGMMAITVFRIISAKGPTKLFFHLMLDMLGFVYIIGSLFFIVSFVDLDREATYRKLVIALLYVVWASDTGAYFFGKLLEAFKFRRSHPLASHLSARKDYEGTFIAIFFGVGAMFLSSHWLHINGTVSEKLIFAAIAVIVGRIGDLFESLLKRAAMVKDSGTLIPGHGGVLDRIDALMFASIVFSRYFGAIIFPDEPRTH